MIIFTNRINVGFLIVINLLIVVSCSFLGPTKPNNPHPGPYPSNFKKLSASNQLLAQELGKLPEIQDGISDIDAMALERLCMFYNKNQKNFDSAFERMYDEGIPDVRRFCTPLQALYWLALEDKLNQLDISKYSLNDLLNEAWYKPGFEYDGLGRWDNFHDVTERLNSPVLLDYYISRNFSYKTVEGVRWERFPGPPPIYIFKKKQGSCSFYTSFSVYCLKKGGYEARAIMVKHNPYSVNWTKHVVTEFKNKDGKAYILDNSSMVFVHRSAIRQKEGFLKIYPYLGTGYQLK